MRSEASDKPNSDDELLHYVDQLLVRNPDVHADAISALAESGDERVIPHLIEVLMIDSIGNQWSNFGFPEVLRDHSPPRYLELPECRWPGVLDALSAIAEPEYDSDHAWVEWETWYSQQSIEPLAGFAEWKLQLYRSYLPPVGRLLDAEPREFDLQDVRWGNCDPSFLAALNGPDFVPGDAVDANGTGGNYERYLKDDDLVFGFEIDGSAYAVPRWVLFPHELLNATIAGQPISLTYCTLCNAPILYDQRVDDQTLTFGSTGMLIDGNKVMFDEETDSLWSQHRGVPIAGPSLDREVRLDVKPITQTEWAEWKAEHPETYALDMDTGYDYDYEFYDGDVGFFRHYWNNEKVVQPGVESADERLPEKEDVYGIPSDDGDSIRVYPVDVVRDRPLIVDEVDDAQVVVLEDATGDVAVYRAPTLPVERNDDVLVDADGTEWKVTRNALVANDEHLERIPGRHGLWFAFRSQYPEATVVSGDE